MNLYTFPCMLSVFNVMQSCHTPAGAILRILIADDHPVVRRGVCSILETRKDLEVCAEAGDGEEAVQKAVELKPDVVILDVMMPRLDGFGAATKILENFQVPILMLSMHDGEEMIRLATSVGAKGFINKTAIVGSLLTAVDIVLAGGTFFRTVEN